MPETRPESLPQTAALIVAAGRGSRFAGAAPKQYACLGGQPLLRRAAAALLAHPAIGTVACVIHPDDGAAYARATAGLPLLPAVAGGPTRQASVRNGLESLANLPEPPARVLIHDAARPLLMPAVVDRVLAALADAPGAIPALAVVDTLKRADGAGAIAETVPRAGLWRAQTPQGFDFAAILAAHRAAPHEDFTDDADLMQAAGHRVRLVEGDDILLKVTTAADLARLAALLAATRETRTGFGYDVHAFAEPKGATGAAGAAGAGDHVTLGGVRIPHTRGLAGHSDADVGLHALCDALYGALAEGDIGQHFPPSEAAWAGTDSAVFLRHAMARVAARGGRVLHLDLTLVCERPKIGPHRDAMRARIAALAGLAPDRVAVKATTSERLGFTGREEGIAAHAVATVELPAGTPESAEAGGRDPAP
ncbi:MAG: bifunctional 2-C-methyl-D-erythritol 4-phosphate cytidylyltransferase/2-C-methyl-D-erythritol 2,4-cyclodiphosphate synthase [Alphaproteobacteria bacterium]|nr:bifunctional 2-C-methyl-D-erythritol 4-phosphate cytidylyltransferase/2-C-methyl-D-erythritol 2,4-cyclodiphosphate synthase [Alphaproteobacteria bacterium]